MNAKEKETIDLNREKLTKLINGALKSTIDAHGPISNEFIISASKRIIGAILSGCNFEDLIPVKGKIRTNPLEKARTQLKPEHIKCIGIMHNELHGLFWEYEISGFTVDGFGIKIHRNIKNIYEAW